MNYRDKMLTFSEGLHHHADQPPHVAPHHPEHHQNKWGGGGGGPTPFFPKTHRNLDLGMGKKVYEKRGKQNFYFQNRKNSHFCP